MAVVRELVNRIGFKINRGELQTAEDAFGGLKGKGLSLINFMGLIGKSIGAAALAFVGFQTTATKSFIKLEQDISDVNFFSKNQKEAKETIKLFDEISGKSETTSRREATRAAKTFSQFTTNKEIVKDLAGFVEKISIARAGLDFDEVAASLGRVIKNADVQEFQELVPGIKFDLEALSKARFGTPFAQTSQAQRAELALSELIKREKRLDELVAEQKEKIPFAVEKVGKQTEDFFLTFGEKTAAPMIELLNLISATIKDINASEGFWKSVESSANAVKIAFETVNKFREDVNEKGLVPAIGETARETVTEFIESKTPTETTTDKILAPLKFSLKQGIKNIVGLVDIIKEAPKQPAQPIGLEQFAPARPLPPLRRFGEPETIPIGQRNQEQKTLQAVPDAQQPKKLPDQSININAEIKLTGENVGAINLSSIQAELTNKIKDMIGQPLKAIINENGGATALG